MSRKSKVDSCASMIREGYRYTRINGMKFLRRDDAEQFIFNIAPINVDGFMTQKQAKHVQRKFGMADHVHSCYDITRKRSRITGLEYIDLKAFNEHVECNTDPMDWE